MNIGIDCDSRTIDFDGIEFMLYPWLFMSRAL